MVMHNIMKVKANEEPIAPVFAESIPRQAKAESSKRASGLISKIIIIRKTVFQLISNLWTAAGLTNGSVGTIHSIIYAKGQCDQSWQSFALWEAPALVILYLKVCISQSENVLRMATDYFVL
jgi:hypothetical protein